MRGLAIGVATLAFLLVAGLVLGPLFIDANRYKGELAAWFGAHAGIDLTLSGPIDLQLLPNPRLVARDISVIGLPGLPQSRMQVRSLEASVDPWPLLSGRVEVRSATLVEPALTWERVSGSGTRPSRQPVTDLAIDRVEIQNGSFTYRDGARVELLEHVNATLRLESLQGPYRIEGDLATHGAALRFEASAGRLDGPETALRIAVTSRPSSRLVFDGSMTSGGGLKGKVTASGDDLAAVASLAGGIGLPAVFAARYSLAADMGEVGGVASFDNLALELGDLRGRGNLKITGGAPLKVAGAIAVTHIDLDRLSGKPVTPGRAASPPPVPPESGSAIAIAPVQPSTANQPFALPQGVEATLDLSVGDVVWREKLVRDVRLDLRLAEGGLVVNRLAAGLPGGTDAVLRGTLAARDGSPRFDGAFQAGADNLRGLLDWLGVATDAVPVGRLGRASLSLRVEASPNRIEVSEVDASIDATRVSGAASIVPGDRLGVGARLRADRFNLDAYLPQGSVCGAALPDLGALGLFDANLDVSLDAVTCRGQTLAGGHLSGTLRAGSLALQDFSFADFADGSLRVSGALEGLGGARQRADLAYELQGATLARIVRFLEPRSGLAAEGWGGLGLSGTLQGSPGAFVLEGEADLMAGRAHVSVRKAGGTIDLGADLTLRQIRLKDALAVVGAAAPLEARVDLDAKLQSRGQNAEELVANLSGEGQVSAREGVFAGVDLRAAAARYAAESPADIAALLRENAGTTPMTSLAGKVTLAKSVLKAEGLTIDLAGATAVAGLSLDLKAGLTQGKIDLTLTGARSVAVTVEGPASAPRAEIPAER